MTSEKKNQYEQESVAVQRKNIHICSTIGIFHMSVWSDILIKAQYPAPGHYSRT